MKHGLFKKIALNAVVLAAFTALTASAESVAKIGETEYETLAAAIEAADAGATVKMLDNVELKAVQTISKAITLDLNGKTISSTIDEFITIAKGGDLTINDEVGTGRIENTSTGANGGVIDLTGGILTVKGGTIASNKATSQYSPTIAVETSSAAIINVTGGRIEADRTGNAQAIRFNSQTKATLNVTGGEIVASQNAVYCIAGCKLINIAGGTLISKTGNAVYSANQNAITISGGTLTSGGKVASLGIGGNGCTVTVGREGGSVSDVDIPSIDFKGSFSSYEATVYLLSGTVQEFRNFDKITVATVSQGKAKFLTGTDISSKLPNTNLLCQKDEVSGLYEIVALKVENAAAVITRNGKEVPCNTVGQAVTALADGDMLTLNADYKGTLAITKKNVTLDLGGNTLTCTDATGESAALQINQSADDDNTVTVKNGKIVTEAQAYACIRATSGSVAKTLTLVLEDLTFKVGSNNRSGKVVLNKGARTKSPCEAVNNGGLLVTEDGQAWIYGETATAFSHANGAEVTLLNDWYCTDYEGTVKVPSSGTFASAKLNLNGKTIKSYGGSNPAILMGAVGVHETDKAVKSLEISNGCIETSHDGAAVCGSNKSLTLDDVTLTTTGDDKFGIYTNGMTTDNTVTLKNRSSVSSETGYGIFFSGAGTLTVEDSTVTGSLSGIEIRAGTLNVSGESVIGSTATKFSCEGNDNGPTTVGAAVAAVKHTVGNDLTVNISGGTFKGVEGFYENDPNVDKEGTVTVAISGGTFSTAIDAAYCAPGYIPTENEDGTYGVKAAYVAAVGETKYETLAEAIAAAKDGETIKLLADTKENVTIAKKLTLDLNGFTLNGGTEKGKPALTVTAKVTVKDSSTDRAGTIKREDTAVNSGNGSHYVIDIQGDGWLTFESGKVTNGSGNADRSRGASLVRVGDDSVAKYPGLNIKGGTFTQDNFIVIKVDRGDLFLNGGTLTSANSYVIENWHRTTIKGGTANGAVAAWTYSDGANSSLKISGGTIDGDVTAVNYGNAEGKTAKVEISGGRVNGNLDTCSYDPKTGDLASITDAEKAAIAVSGGTFNQAVDGKYCADGFTPLRNTDGTYGVEQQVLAKIGDTEYYTMDAAFHAVKAGETIVLQRDYTTSSEQNSGNDSFTIDLNNHTWAYTGSDVESAAFEINYANVTLTVKNGKVVSASMLGLIPSASSMKGTITYDNAGLVFEKVEATANGHSGIETNGNNTDDVVTLKDSTLNVPNGYGIYFASSGKVTIENSIITAKTMGVQVCSGNLEISGDKSKIEVTGDAVAKTENDGAIEDGAAVSVVNRPGYKGLGTIAISGGTFKAKDGNAAIKAYTWENKTESAFDNANGTVAVCGGTFSTAVDEAFCAAGFIPMENADDTYGVKQGAYVAAIGETKYETLAEAIAAANDNDTVKLLADAPQEGAQLVIPKDKKLTLDLNGQTLKVSKYTANAAQVSVFGALTVTDSSEKQSGVICSDYTGTAGLVVQVEKGGKLTMAGGTITTDGMANAGNAVKVVSGGEVEMTGGTIRCDAKRGNRAVNVYGNFTMTGGFVVADAGDGSETYIIAVCGNNGSEIAISGTAQVSGPEAVSAKSANATITGGNFTGTITVTKGVSGGTFDQEVVKSACVIGFVSVKNDDGTYGVKDTFKTIQVKVSAESEDTIGLRVAEELLAGVSGETIEEKALNLNAKSDNGILAWVNLVAGIGSKITVDASQNVSKTTISLKPSVNPSENTDAKVVYSVDKIDESGNVLVAGAKKTSPSIALADVDKIARFRVNVIVQSADGTDAATLVAENVVGVLKTTAATKKTIVAVPWLSLAGGGNVSVANLVKTANLTVGDKLHVYNATAKRYDVYELAKDKTWTPKAIYTIGANGAVATVSSGTPESTTVARGSGVWLERQKTDQPIVSYGQVPTATVETAIAAGTADAPAWNLLAVPTTEAVNLAEKFGRDENAKIIVPTVGAPKIYTVENVTWGYTKTVPVRDRWDKTEGVKVVREAATELPAGTGFWYLNGGSAKTINW